mmetsp:Transcript_31823/g.107187  ORF Transcript_31823/g.107187 Transcript_31823/m.107187 type:complete len:139 (+) Transcript_31823:233-649(+)
MRTSTALALAAWARDSASQGLATSFDRSVAARRLCVPLDAQSRNALDRGASFLPDPRRFAAEAPRDADAEKLHARLRSLGSGCSRPFLPIGGSNAFGSLVNALVLPLAYAVDHNRTALTPPLGAYASDGCDGFECHFK